MVRQNLATQMKQKFSELPEEDRVEIGVRVLQLMRELQQHRESLIGCCE